MSIFEAILPAMNCFYQAIFFTCVFLILYTYVIFPAILFFLSKGKSLQVPPANGQKLKSVAVLISVYNEESVIAQKIESILDCNFPQDRLQILIGSDSSIDRTCEIGRTFEKKYPIIKIFDFKERRGKPTVINELVTFCESDLLILTDANVYFGKDVLEKLIHHFNDDTVGLVGANILNIGMKRDGISIQEKSYIERENLIKYREGILWGSMMGPFGGCYAVRKDLYENVPPNNLVDDFFISMKILEKKFKCINDLEAVCYEDVSNDIIQEYKRKSRISAGNYQNLNLFKRFLFRPFTPVGFCFIGHKFLRWITPFLILLSVFSLAILSLYNPVYLYLLIGEIILILSPGIDWLARKLGLHLRFLRFVSYFTFMNLAMLKGFFKFLGGVSSGIWTPTKRT